MIIFIKITTCNHVSQIATVLTVNFSPSPGAGREVHKTLIPGKYQYFYGGCNNIIQYLIAISTTNLFSLQPCQQYSVGGCSLLARAWNHEACTPSSCLGFHTHKIPFGHNPQPKKTKCQMKRDFKTIDRSQRSGISYIQKKYIPFVTY